MNVTRTRKNAWPAAVETVSRCLEAGVRDYVVCGGARNAPLLEALARAGSSVKLWRHFEERSAGFFALGRTIIINGTVNGGVTAASQTVMVVSTLVATIRRRASSAVRRIELRTGSGVRCCTTRPTIARP